MGQSSYGTLKIASGTSCPLKNGKHEKNTFSFPNLIQVSEDTLVSSALEGRLLHSKHRAMLECRNWPVGTLLVYISPRG